MTAEESSGQTENYPLHPLKALLALSGGDHSRLVDELLRDSSDQLVDSQGIRMCPLTPSGVPYEASISIGAEEAAGQIRFSAVAGSRHRYFTEQLKIQKETTARAGRLLPPGAAEQWQEQTAQLMKLVFPEPAAVPARTRLVSALGVALEPETGALLGLRLYCNLQADPDSFARLAGSHQSWERLALTVVPTLGLSPRLAAIELTADDRLRTRLYVMTPRGGLLPLLGALSSDQAVPPGTSPEVAGQWERVLGPLTQPPCFVSMASDPKSQALSATVHLRRAAFEECGLDPDLLCRDLAAGIAGGPAQVDKWQSELSGPDCRWRTTVVGLALGSRGEVCKLNAYAEPESSS